MMCSKLLSLSLMFATWFGGGVLFLTMLVLFVDLCKVVLFMVGFSIVWDLQEGRAAQHLSVQI